MNADCHGFKAVVNPQQTIIVIARSLAASVPRLPIRQSTPASACVVRHHRQPTAQALWHRKRLGPDFARASALTVHAPCARKCVSDNQDSDTFRFRGKYTSRPAEICGSAIVHSQFTGFKIFSVIISNPPDYLAHAPIIDSLTFVMLSHTTTRPTLARSLH